MIATLIIAVALSLASTNEYKFTDFPTNAVLDGVGLDGVGGNVRVRYEDVCFLWECAAERKFVIDNLAFGPLLAERREVSRSISWSDMIESINAFSDAAESGLRGQTFYFANAMPQSITSWKDDDIESALFGGAHSNIAVNVSVKRGDALALTNVVKLFEVQGAFKNAVRCGMSTYAEKRKVSRDSTSTRPVLFARGYANGSFYYDEPYSYDSGEVPSVVYQDESGFSFSKVCRRALSAYAGYDGSARVDSGLGSEDYEAVEYEYPVTFYLPLDDSFATNGATYSVERAYLAVEYVRSIWREKHGEEKSYIKYVSRSNVLVPIDVLEVVPFRDRHGYVIILCDSVTAQSLAESVCAHFGDKLPSFYDTSPSVPQTPPDVVIPLPVDNFDRNVSIAESKVEVRANTAVIILNVTFNARTISD